MSRRSLLILFPPLPRSRNIGEEFFIALFDLSLFVATPMSRCSNLPAASIITPQLPRRCQEGEALFQFTNFRA